MASRKEIRIGKKLLKRWPYKSLNRIQRSLLGKSGVEIMAEDWDNLIILDACRYDLFEEVSDLPGNLTKKISKGSHTTEFLEKNFQKKKFHDTIYISATPQLTSLNYNQNFYHTKNIWKTDWDNKLNTVPPKAVRQAAIQAEDQYPNKRLIIHFLQPHYPFIGATGRKIQQGSLTGGGLIADQNNIPDIWELLQKEEVKKETVWDAYKENLELVLPEVRYLIENLCGKSVVTSDHGNSLGRWGIYGHPSGIFMRDLVQVPWLTIDTETRKNIESTQPETQLKIEESEEVSKKLEYLGYK